MPESINKNVFISGTNRGIGFELTLQLSKIGYNIIAGYRNDEKSKNLFEEARRVNNIFPIKINIIEEIDVQNVKNYIKKDFGYLDIIINNAGVNVNPSAKLNDVSWYDIEKSLLTNIGGPFLSTKILYPLVKNGKEKKIINISSIMGSIHLSNGGSTPYRLSKAGLNMLTKNQAVEYKLDGITVVSIHPGWVKTSMGGESATISVEESARKIIEIIKTVSLSNSGEFISVNGDTIPF